MNRNIEIVVRVLTGLILMLSLVMPFSLQAQGADTVKVERKIPFLRGVKSTQVHNVSVDTVQVNDTLVQNTDSVAAVLRHAAMKEFQDSLRKDSIMRADYGNMKIFKPDPNRAMWLSLLFPGLGQVYNRRYWKLPIVVGGFVGLGYATAWNNRMYTDYTKAYRDAMDNDPSTNSYMDFYPPTVKEEDIDMAWLKRALKAKKDYYRRNKELCVISMVGMYLLCVVDAYVDASLMNFDISDDLSMRVKPAVIEPRYTGKKLPSVGVQCAFNF